MKLYQITEQYNSALSELESSNLPQDVINDTLEGLKGDIQVKTQNVAAFILNRQAEIEAVKGASRKLSERARIEQNNLDGLKSYLLLNMEATGTTEVRSPEIVVKIRNNPSKVIIDETIPLDKKFMVEKITSQPDKKIIKEAIKSGETVNGAHLEKTKSLVIK